ncbi:MAG: TIGR02186 family protein [Acidobacteriota bacterium]
MHRLAISLALALTLPARAAQASDAITFVETRRVNVTITFSGQEVFLYGQAPPGTTRVVAVMESGSAGPVRLMEKGRVALFWMGVRQYRLTDAPGLYLVNANCTVCNHFASCTHDAESESWNPVLAPLGIIVGRGALRASATLECLSGSLRAGELDRALEGFWALQSERDLYRVRGNGLRLNGAGAFYHRFLLPSQAPDGRYTIVTYFLSDGALLGREDNELFVRKSGLVAWLSRLADRQAALYASLAIAIALAAGWLAGALFRRGGGH